MRKWFLIFLFPLLSGLLYGQQKTAAEELVDQGVALEDSGKSVLAMEKYQAALDLDKDNLAALTEMAYSLMSVEKYEESVKFCKRALKTHKNERGLNTVYVSYGNALDAMKQVDHAIEIYNEGIHLFPDYFQLYFNKGIALAGVNKNHDAIGCFQRSIELNPGHAGSNLALGNICLSDNIRIPALMAYSRFLIIEPESKRSVNGLASLRKILEGNVTITGQQKVTIHVDPSMLDVKNEKQQSNNFASVELILAMSAATENDSAIGNLSNIEKFVRKFETICESLKSSEKENFGFYWDYYAPYFIELNDQKQVRTFAYIAYASTGDKEVSDWLESHKKEIDLFYKWSDDFKWRIN